MKIVLIGPQSSGKGTQSKMLSKKLNLPHISTGELLRSTKGKLREEIDALILKGKLVPNRLIWTLLKKRLSMKDCKKGWILDNFPRNLQQAKILDRFTKIDKIIEIQITDKEVLRRSLNRGRDDDKKAAIKTRLKIYHQDTKLLRHHYTILSVNGKQSVKKVSREIVEKAKSE